jgi:hypothetical protein
MVIGTPAVTPDAVGEVGVDEPMKLMQFDVHVTESDAPAKSETTWLRA